MPKGVKLVGIAVSALVVGVVANALVMRYRESVQQSGAAQQQGVANQYYCSASRPAQRSQHYDQLEEDIRVLVDACWNFQEQDMGESGEPRCGLAIPYHDEVSDAVRGKGDVTLFDSELMPRDEPFLGVVHFPCLSPRISIDGMVISGRDFLDCRGDFYCSGPVAGQIRSTDVRGHDLASKVHEFAVIAERRYNQGNHSRERK
jgi:hypothetical protein